MGNTSYEIERKFKTKDDSFLKNVVRKIDIKQAYISSSENIRVRIINNTTAELTLKRAIDGNDKHAPIKIEQNIDISLDSANKVIRDFAGGVVIHKTRNIVEENGNKWEVDVFHGEYEGLVLAEIEGDCEKELMKIKKPKWLGKEVSRDDKYSNRDMYLRMISEK